MEYKVVTADFHSSLAYKVNEYLRKGWKVQGGISYNPTTRVYMQAIVRSNFIDDPTDFGQGGF